MINATRVCRCGRTIYVDGPWDRDHHLCEIVAELKTNLRPFLTRDFVDPPAALPKVSGAAAVVLGAAAVVAGNPKVSRRFWKLP